MNNFLKEQTQYYELHKLGTTQLILNDDTNELLGYFTLKNTAMLINLDDKKLRGESAVEILRLAIDKKYQNLGIGSKTLKAILMDIYQYSLEFAAVKMVVLYSLPKSVDFYIKNQFLPLKYFMNMLYDECQNNCVSMYFNMLNFGYNLDLGQVAVS
jgi:ribosomal protein S18 acetylase RimI-like enzyme